MFPSLIVYSQKFKTEIDTFSYSLGINIASNLKSKGIEELNTNMIIKAFEDIYNEKELSIDMEKADNIVNNYFVKVQEMAAEKNIEKGKEFLEENKKNDGIIELPSGLQYKILKEGEGEKPSINDNVTCHYKGTLIDGTVFDSSYDRGEPIEFPVRGVIDGWTEALQLMAVGSKWMLYIPSNLAYGDRGAGDRIGPNETLIFEVELLSIN
ncbi:FKBP-type peptidyl-prolyl cis-trans isomerase [Bacteroidota bacterium]